MVKLKLNMSNFEEIKDKDKILAIILRADFTSDTVKFFTPDSFSQQLGFLPHKKGKILKPHIHKKVDRKIEVTQEVLFIKKGRIRVDLYNEDKKFVTSRELLSGDVILLCSGGHGFEVLEDLEMIEVKQGPYSGVEGDKEVF